MWQVQLKPLSQVRLAAVWQGLSTPLRQVQLKLLCQVIATPLWQVQLTPLRQAQLKPLSQTLATPLQHAQLTAVKQPLHTHLSFLPALLQTLSRAMLTSQLGPGLHLSRALLLVVPMLALLVLLLSGLPKQRGPDPGLTRALHLHPQPQAPLQDPLLAQLLHLLLLLLLSLLLLLLHRHQLLPHHGHTCVGPDAQPGPPPLPCWLLGTA